MVRQAFMFLQQIGKSLMLPVAVLPVAGLLLGIGSGLLTAEISWIPPVIPQIMSQSGNVIFANMPLIFAIGTTLGLTDNDGVAALAAVTGFLVMLATMGVMADVLWFHVSAGQETLGVLAQSLDYDVAFARKIVTTNMGIKTIETAVCSSVLSPHIFTSGFTESNCRLTWVFSPVSVPFRSLPLWWRLSWACF